ncbi:hypothetical protein EV359DRAFT_88057 [Lentinula novae-zelandiae]|nr:hypothetical protein EV359DRAFT_88057 [Lentinula novae-zelandiae]
MSTSRTTTTTIPSRSNPRAGPLNPPMPPPPTRNAEDDDDDEEEITKVQRVKDRKAEEAARKKAEEEEERRRAARERVACEAQERAIQAHLQKEEVVERRRLLAEAATTRSQRGTSPSERSASPRRPVVEVRRVMKGKGKGKAKALPVGGDPDDGDDRDDNDDNDEEDRAPCERCRNKKLPCQMQAGKRSSIICKPCHDAKVKCLYSGHLTTSKQREGRSGERIAVMESQMAQGLADLRALQEANSKSQQYLRQLLRRQEDDHARLISIETRMAETRMAMMGMGKEPAAAGPSRRTTEQRRPLK